MWYGVDTWWSPGVAEGLQVAKWLKFDVLEIWGKANIAPGVKRRKCNQNFTGDKYEFTDLVIQNLNRV